MTNERRPSSLPFDPDEISVVRLNQAQIAELFGVSRQAVNQWVKNGRVTPFADGTLDPTRVAQELARNADPRRLRNKIFRRLNAETEELRAEVARLRDELCAAHAETEYRRFQATELLAEALALSTWNDRFLDRLESLDLEHRQVPLEEWRARLDALYAEVTEDEPVPTPETLRPAGLAQYADLLPPSVSPGCPPSGDEGAGE